MRKTRLLTVEVKREELNILDALSLIDGIVSSFKYIRNNIQEMNSQVDACIEFAKNFALDS